jgi:putative proteasome-type protease
MTYCVGVLLNEGLIFASDSRTHAGVDNFSSFCKMTVFERKGDRVLVLLSSGNLAGTQAVISVLKQQAQSQSQRQTQGESEVRAPTQGQSELRAPLQGQEQPRGAEPTIWTARTMFDTANLVADAMRSIERRDQPYLARSDVAFNASFILGGQIKGEPMRLFRIYAEGNFIEAGTDTPYFQTGEAKYGKPIIDRVITPATTLADAAKCVLVSFDSTMRSNLSVAMPIDLASYERDALAVKRRRFEPGDAYFRALSAEWSEGVRTVFRQLPELDW